MRTWKVVIATYWLLSMCFGLFVGDTDFTIKSGVVLIAFVVWDRYLAALKGGNDGP